MADNILGSEVGQTGGTNQSQTSGNPTSGAQTNNQTTDWRETLPEDIKKDGALAQFKDVASLAKSYVHAQSMIGKKGVVVPGEKATDEEWKHFYKSVGQPELDKYELNIPKDKKVDDEFVKKFKENAHKSGMLPKQANEMLGWYMQEQEVASKVKEETSKAEKENNEFALKREWGDGYQRNLAVTIAGIKEVGGEDLLNKLISSDFGNDPVVIKAFNKVGKLLGEDKLKGINAGNPGQTPDEIQAEIDSIRGNLQHPYFDSNHPGHRTAVQQMEALYKKRYS